MPRVKNVSKQTVRFTFPGYRLEVKPGQTVEVPQEYLHALVYLPDMTYEERRFVQGMYGGGKPRLRLVEEESDPGSEPPEEEPVEPQEEKKPVEGEGS